MPSIKFNCPQCGARGAAFSLLHDSHHPTEDYRWFSMAKCGVCLKAVLFDLEHTNNQLGPSESPFLSDIDLKSCYPANPEPEIPDSIPQNVVVPLTEAEHSFAAGHYSAAGSCYRKAMERSLKHLDPELKGMLNQRIRELEKKGLLPTGMIELLDQVRLFGNSTMHEDDFDPTSEDCTAAREFSQLFLTYAFSLPSKVLAAKAKLSKP